MARGKKTTEQPVQPIQRVVWAEEWQKDIFVPVTQNIVGGAAVMILGWLYYYAQNHVRPTIAQETNTIIAGVAVACLITVVRCFGDDVGIVAGATRVGWQAQQMRVEALQAELRQSQAEIAHMRRATSSMPRTQNMEAYDRLRKDAQQLIDWHFEGLPISRSSCQSRNMGPKAWQRARRMLIAAGAMDDEGMVAKTSVEALRLLADHWNTINLASGNKDNFVTPA